MAGANICGSPNVAAFLRNEKLPCSSEVLESFRIPKSSPTLRASKPMVNFENAVGVDTTSTQLFQSLDREEKVYEDFDGCFIPPEKKRRLTTAQVQFLDKNFEVENKLEPERKFKLAKELGLQPRQVAIWFQNRRARSKNQRLERDYDSLKTAYDKLKADYDNLLKENGVLKKEIVFLKDKLLIREKGKEKLETLEDINSLEGEPQKTITNADTKAVYNVPMMACKREDANSAKSDVFDSHSTHCAHGNHSPLIDPADSSQAFEPDQSDVSQDEEDNLSKGLLPPPYFFKLEDCCYDDPPIINSCNFGYSMEDQAFWSWPY